MQEANCTGRLAHVDHDSSTVGKAVIKTAEGNLVEMNLIISRFSAEEKTEAKELCAELKQAQKSKAKLDILFKEFTYEDGTKAPKKIKGAKKLHGLNPLING